MPYNPALVAPMRQEMTRMGARELTTEAEVVSSLAPMRVISWRIGATRAGLYGMSLTPYGLFGGDREARCIQSRLERVPREAGALHPDRKLRHSGEHGEFVQGFRLGRVERAGDQAMEAPE